jgi:hypothetical protein
MGPQATACLQGRPCKRKQASRHSTRLADVDYGGHGASCGVPQMLSGGIWEPFSTSRLYTCMHGGVIRGLPRWGPRRDCGTYD